ncbi:MAG: (R)-stereoselective amidase [Ignavibacteria bacterium]|nr:(R)-stereoselective amidase [Ignavibacteria bacterium]
MKVGYFQFKPEYCNPEKNISIIEKNLSGIDIDLIVLPELANSGYLFSRRDDLFRSSENISGGIFINALKRISSKNKFHIVSGICERSENKFYNTSVLICPEGKVITYRKLHLFDTEKKWFEAGNMPISAIEINGKKFGKVRIGMMICFDWIFPETMRTLALKGAQIICHPSNLVMPYCQRAMTTRALENHVFTITANRTGMETAGGKTLTFTGQSVIVSPKGKYLQKASKNRKECAIVKINPKEALDKKINPVNDLFKDRRKKFYFNE